MTVDIAISDIELEWRRMMECGDHGVWRRASIEMCEFQEQGYSDDEAALMAMRKVGWLKPVESLSDQAASEYDEIIASQDMLEMRR